MIFPVTPTHHAELARFLAAHEAGAMFPLAALERGEVLPPGAALPSPYAMHGWIAETAGKVAGFLGLSRAGFLVPHMPGGDWSAFRPLLAGREVAAAVGPADQVPALLAALGLADARRRADKDEPGFALTLDRLALPPMAGHHIQPLTAEYRLLVEGWRISYLQEMFAEPPDTAALRAAEDLARWIAADSHRLLFWQGRPVALSGFNARLPQVVQVGGVYTPPPLRGQGFARRAVALHLAEAREAGVLRAVLFAASEAAASAYRAIGFIPAGRMAIVELDRPAQVTT